MKIAKSCNLTMNKLKEKKEHKASAFTMVEVLIVIAIMSFILVVIVITIPSAKASGRDTKRKQYAQQVMQALEDYYKSNNSFPGCATTCSNMNRFLQEYLPDGQDPNTGGKYNSPNLVSLPNGIATTESANSALATVTVRPFIFYDHTVSHNTKPEIGQIYIATGDRCYNLHPDGGNGPPLASSAGIQLDEFAVVAYQDHGGYFCLDNYTP
jgi:type II secretory pathway pseudopilin PulG